MPESELVLKCPSANSVEDDDEDDFLNVAVKLNPAPNLGLIFFRSFGLNLLIGLEEPFFLFFFPSANQSSWTRSRVSLSSEPFSEFVPEDLLPFLSVLSLFETVLKMVPSVWQFVSLFVVQNSCSSDSTTDELHITLSSSEGLGPTQSFSREIVGGGIS